MNKYQNSLTISPQLTGNSSSITIGTGTTGATSSINTFYCNRCFGYHYGSSGCNLGLLYPYVPLVNIFPVTVRKVENGWIVTKNGQEFVCLDKNEIVKFID